MFEKLDLADEQLLPELALNCILSETCISVVIPAMMQLRHLQSNIKAVEHCRFSSGELALIRRALQIITQVDSSYSSRRKTFTISTLHIVNSFTLQPTRSRQPLAKALSQRQHESSNP